MQCLWEILTPRVSVPNSADETVLKLAQGKIPAGMERLIYHSLCLGGLYLSCTEQPQVQTESLPAVWFSSHHPLRSHGGKKGRRVGLFAAEGPPPVLHMRPWVCECGEPNFPLCSKDHCLKIVGCKNYRVRCELHWTRIPVIIMCPISVWKLSTQKRLCNYVATFSVSVLVFLNNFANFSVVYS